MAGRRRGRYPPEYKERIVELVRAGRSPGSVAREFEPSEQTIRNWVKQADLDEGLGSSDGLTTEARKEMQGAEAGRQAAADGAGHPKKLSWPSGGWPPRGTETMLRAGAEVVRLTGARSPLKNVTKALRGTPQC